VPPATLTSRVPPELFKREQGELHDDKAIGVDIVNCGLEEPIREVVQKTGHEGVLVVGRVRESKDENFGFHAGAGEFGDLVKAGGD